MCEYEFLFFRWRSRKNFSIAHWYIWTIVLLYESIRISNFRWRTRDNFRVVHRYIWTIVLCMCEYEFLLFRWRPRDNFSIAHWYIWTIVLLYESIRISPFQMENEGQLQCCPLVHINNSAIVCVNMNFYFSDGDRGRISSLPTGTYKQ